EGPDDVVHQKRRREQEQREPRGVGPGLESEEIGDRIRDEEAQNRVLDRDQETPRQDLETHAVEKGQIGGENKGGADGKPDPLPETDRNGQSERREKEGGDESDRQQKKGPQNDRPNHGALSLRHAALKRAHSDS